MKMKLASMSAMFGFFTLFVLSVIPAKADKYGADAITDLFSGLWNSFWPLVALLFIVGLVLSAFVGPKWLQKVFGAFDK